VEGIKASGLDLPGFIRTGVVSGLRQLLEFGLFHGDPHPGNIFALRDGRIAYVDFGNVAELSQRNKEVGADGCGWGHGWVLGGVVDWLAGWLAGLCASELLLLSCSKHATLNVSLSLRLPRHSPAQVLIDAVVHAVNKDYPGMAGDFIKLGFLAQGE
jgi:hypothetical protein